MRKRLLPLLVLVCVASGIWQLNARKSRDAAINRNLTTFNSIVKELELNYVDSLDPDKLIQDAIDGMLSDIDPYTVYYSSDDQEQVMRMTTGDYGGIGSYIMERDGSTYISEPIAGSPSLEVGLRAGDRIVRVDTTDVSKWGSEKVTKLLRGTPGTTVVVTVNRPYVQNGDSVLTFNIERRKLHESSVPYSKLYDDGTGYIRLTSFIDKTPDEMRAALTAFKNDPRFNKLVLDLRGNGGGLLESAIDVVGFFVPRGTEVLRTRGRDLKSEKIYKTTRKPLLEDIPMVVLIDGASASASEITAGALQDLDRAVLVGSPSYGKGLVQSTRAMPFEGMLKLTTSKYYIPSGRLIQAVDYSNRNPDGSVARTPDSLTNVFKTKHGREVRDGGGLKPDVTVEFPTPSRLVYNIVRDHWSFDYATRFAAQNPQIAPAEEFEITDSIYSDFKKFINPEKFQYDKVGVDLLKQLRDIVDAEGYMNEETSAAIDSLGVLLTHDLQGDLDLKRDEISEYLAEEIATRYYPDNGGLIQTLKRDKGLAKAREILNDPKRYKEILKAGK